MSGEGQSADCPHLMAVRNRGDHTWPSSIRVYTCCEDHAKSGVWKHTEYSKCQANVRWYLCVLSVYLKKKL